MNTQSILDYLWANDFRTLWDISIELTAHKCTKEDMGAAMSLYHANLKKIPAPAPKLPSESYRHVLIQDQTLIAQRVSGSVKRGLND